MGIVRRASAAVRRSCVKRKIRRRLENRMPGLKQALAMAQQSTAVHRQMHERVQGIWTDLRFGSSEGTLKSLQEAQAKEDKTKRILQRKEKLLKRLT